MQYSQPKGVNIYASFIHLYSQINLIILCQSSWDQKPRAFRLRVKFSGTAATYNIYINNPEQLTVGSRQSKVDSDFLKPSRAVGSRMSNSHNRNGLHLCCLHSCRINRRGLLLGYHKRQQQVAERGKRIWKLSVAEGHSR